ncbi:MAG: hypothetical protein M1814_003202 [Vezdaea aestivalis]|nr:MAG: hypothetical protein M1814_003202 [Vezdaea aestivalis]
MSDSESSALSSVPSDDEPELKLTSKNGILKFVPVDRPKASTKETTAPVRKREPSPPHEYTLADNFDIPFLVMFRSRFNDCFPKSLTHYGPQDIERGIQDSPPGEHVENYLCALLGLVLNRKKNPERGHFHRAIEEALSTQKPQWPFSWKGISPLAGAKTFATMSPSERLSLMKALALWALTSSESVSAAIKESYKQNRHNDDLNQPLSVQPWGKDGRKYGPVANYYLIEGLDDTHFRVYRDTSAYKLDPTFYSVAGDIPELKSLAAELRTKGSQISSRLSDNIEKAIPRFEATDEKRKRREYRVMRKQQFSRPEPGFSLYEGRTRGKRMKYTFSDDEDEDSDVPSNHRSLRNSGKSTPIDAPQGPTFTASGRQVKSRMGGAYGETVTQAHQAEETSTFEGHTNGVNGRARRSGLRQEENGWTKGVDHIETYNSVDEMEEEEEEAASSGAEDYGGGDFDNEDGAADSPRNDENMSDDGSDQEAGSGAVKKSISPVLMVSLKVGSRGKRNASSISGDEGKKSSIGAVKSDGDLINGVKSHQAAIEGEKKTNGLEKAANGALSPEKDLRVQAPTAIEPTR